MEQESEYLKKIFRNSMEKKESLSTDKKCPFCGGENLIEISVCQTEKVARHNSIMIMALVFCAGLMILCWLPSIMGTRGGLGWLAYNDLLADMRILIVICALLYLTLRRSEGDFRALFMIAFSLFIWIEGLAALTRGYNLVTLDALGVILNICLFMYSSLAVTAAIADGPKRDFYHRALLIASIGFLLLATLRICFSLRSGGAFELHNQVITAFMAIIAIGVAIMIGRARLREKAKIQNSKSDL